MFQESEVINLFFGLVATLIGIFFLPRRQLQGYTWLWVGFSLIVAALLFTVLEGVLWYDLFQTLEHLSYALAGCCFAIGCYRLQRRTRRAGDRS